MAQRASRVTIIQRVTELVSTGTQRYQKVWRSQKEAGLQFIESEALDGPAGGKEGAVTIATRFAWRLNGG